jgi:hypothetical protein
MSPVKHRLGHTLAHHWGFVVTLKPEELLSVARDRRAPISELSRAALAFRAFHAAIAVEQLLAIGYVWWCALTGRRGRLLRIAAATLIGEGVLVTAKGGDCPLGGLQERFGDPVPLFELVLSPRAAKQAVPTLGAIAAAGLVLLVARGRRGRVCRQAVWPQVRSDGAEAGRAR